MVSETVVSVMLEASITGAGVILAIYALITPIYDRILRERARKLEGLIKEFDKQREKLTADSPSKDFERFNELRDEIKKTNLLPRYLIYGIALTFSLFMGSSLFSMDWLWNVNARTFATEADIILFFVFAWLSLVFVGISTIFEISNMMNKEFEDLKKKQKETIIYHGIRYKKGKTEPS